MYDGEQFRTECLRGAESIDAGKTVADPTAAARARKWAETGSALIDHSESDRAVRYLLATIGNLADQNAVNTQAVMVASTRRLLIPAWIASVALVWIALRG